MTASRQGDEAIGSFITIIWKYTIVEREVQIPEKQDLLRIGGEPDRKGETTVRRKKQEPQSAICVPAVIDLAVEWGPSEVWESRAQPGTTGDRRLAVRGRRQ